MKTTIILFSLLVLIVIPANGNFRQQAMNAVHTCKRSMNADEETMKRLMSGKNFVEKKTACLANCAMEAVGAIKNGQINLEVTINEMIESFQFDAHNANVFREIVKNCKAVAEKSTNKCTVAGEFLYCAKQAIF